MAISIIGAPREVADQRVAAVTALRGRGDELLVDLAAMLALTSGPWRSNVIGRSSQELMLCQCARRLVRHLQAIDETLYEAGAHTERTRLLVRSMRSQYRFAVSEIKRLAHASGAGQFGIAGHTIAAVLRACTQTEQAVLIPALATTPGIGLRRLVDEADNRFRDLGRTLPETLDVREIAHRQRHPVIHAHCRRLAPGQSFTLLYPVDPNSLRRDLGAMCAGQLVWDLLASEPTCWRVRVGRVEAMQASEERLLDVSPIR